MLGEDFTLNESALSNVEEIGRLIPGGFFVYKAEEPGDLLYANQAVFDIWGCADVDEFRELTGFSFRGMVHPEDYDETAASIEEQIRQDDGSLDHVQYRAIAKDGSVRWVDDYGRFVGHAGPGGLFYVFVSDITKLKEQVDSDFAVKKALHEAQMTERENERLMAEVQNAANLADLMGSAASLMSNMPAMSFSKDAQTGVYLACNQPFADYAKKASPEEVIGLTDYEIFDPETAAHFVDDDKKALAMDKPYIFFEDVPDASGEVMRNLQTTKLKFTDASGRLCTLGMCVDVTDIARLKESQAREREMQEKIALQEKLLEEQRRHEQQNSMIVALSSDYRSVYYVDLDNDEAVCYFDDRRFEEAPFSGQRFPYLGDFSKYAYNHVAEPYREGYLQFIQPDNIRAALATQSVITYRFLETGSDQDTYAMIRIAGVRHLEDRTDGQVHAIGVGFADIDAEMRQSMAQQQALSDALTAAEQANRAKTSFLSNMSHEIRTPMNAIIGLDSLALRNEALDEETRDYLVKIGDSARHLLGLINDILDMSRIESGRMALRKDEFSLRDVLDQINTIVMSQCSEKGLRYECRVNGGLSDCYIGDDMKLKQVLINILSNAIKFTDAPGDVALTVERTKTYKGQSTIRFEITDTGIGMDPSFIPKIFDSFTQEDGGRNNKYGSTGLGMAITKNIVELMNGTIEVESEKGVGSRFTVIVTLKDTVDESERIAQMGDVGLNAERKRADLRGRRILLAEDIAINAEIVREVVKMKEAEVDHAENGRAALEMFARSAPGHYDAVLMDVRMPEMDGLEAAAAIRALDRPDAGSVPIIAMTANAFDEDVQRSLQVGMNAHLSKPVEPERLYQTLEELIWERCGKDNVAQGQTGSAGAR